MTTAHHTRSGHSHAHTNGHGHSGAHTVTPLHLAGNTTKEQNEQLLEFLGEAVTRAHKTVIDELDQSSAQAVLDSGRKLKNEVAEFLVEIIHRHTTSDRYKSEQVESDRVYPSTYRLRPIEAQVTELKKFFPSLGSCHERIARRPMLEGAEAWFAIPRWQALATTYNDAVSMVLECIASKRRFQNRIKDRMAPQYLRQSERSKLAESILADQQSGNDILVVASQFGMLHRGCSARRTRVALAGHEFGLGAFAVGCMLLTHPERLSSEDTLMVDCSGDEYSVGGDSIYDRVPLYDYDISGLQFSIFYEDRARNLWGTPTGFLYKMS
jgi:hypothetical protein